MFTPVSEFSDLNRLLLEGCLFCENNTPGKSGETNPSSFAIVSSRAGLPATQQLSANGLSQVNTALGQFRCQCATVVLRVRG